MRGKSRPAPPLAAIHQHPFDRIPEYPCSPGKKVLATLQHLKGEFATRFSVSWIGIFGSVARGEQTEASDIDISVEFSRPVRFFMFLELEEYLSVTLGAPVDLVTPDAFKPVIRNRVAAEVAYA